MAEKNQFGEKNVNEKKNKNKQSKFARYSRIPQKRNQQEPQRQQKPQRTQRHKQKQQPKKVEKKPVRIAFLGGLNEVGKNMTLYEYGDSMMLVDCGLAFPDSDLPGVDLVLPDFSYVEKNIDKVNENIDNALKRRKETSNNVQLIAVSKTKPWEMLQAAYDSGCRLFGENKVQEIMDK